MADESPERRLYLKLAHSGAEEQRDLAAIREALQEARASEAYRLGLEHGGLIRDLVAQRDKLWTALGELAQAAAAGVVSGDNDGAVRWRNTLINIRERAKEVLGK